jgi:Protein of unknown function (DUF3800)
MKIFIDESGSFNWQPEGISLFCAVTIADRELPTLLDSFRLWKQRHTNGGNRSEIKGKDLTPRQQTSFVQYVVLNCKDFWITQVGIDTRMSSRDLAEKFKSKYADIGMAASRWAKVRNKPVVERQYREFAGWIRNRSPEHFMWILALTDVIWHALQNSITSFMELEDNPEWENVAILIDKSFIKQPEHLLFWQEWLRNQVHSISHRKPLLTPREWTERDHPFQRKYSRSDHFVEMSELFRENMDFADSKAHEGLQIADICANICYRFSSRNPKYRAYRLLRGQILGPTGGRGRGGSKLTLLVLDKDSLTDGSPESHVKEFSLEDEKPERENK